MSQVQEYRARFADALVKGDVFSMYFTGKDPVEVIADPVRVFNLVGERSHLVLQVRLVITGATGQMILAPSCSVHAQNTDKEN